MEEKREPDVIAEPEPEKPDTDPEPTPKQRAVALPIEVPPLGRTLRNAFPRHIT